MAFKRKLYPRDALVSTIRGRSSNEIDLRREFDDLIFGGPTSIPHGRKLILRKMRRDASENLIPCTCVSDLTGEPDTERSCPFCLGEGKYWDETFITGYTSYIGADGGLTTRVRDLFPGSVRVDSKIFYFRFDTVITYDDKIVEPVLDSEGLLVVPYRREAVHKPQTIVRYRSDRGRTEYIAIYCRENDAIRLES